MRLLLPTRASFRYAANEEALVVPEGRPEEGDEAEALIDLPAVVCKREDKINREIATTG